MRLKNLITKLIAKSDRKYALKVLEKMFNMGIPFNLPHKFTFIELSAGKTRISLPFKRVNQNHLSGIHACAIATLGEYPAGLTIIKSFGLTKYRLIMKHLDAKYFKQGRGALIGEAIISNEELNRVNETLKIEDSTEVKIITKIMTEDQSDLIAEVTTVWQLKNWEKVTFK